MIRARSTTFDNTSGKNNWCDQESDAQSKSAEEAFLKLFNGFIPSTFLDKNESPPSS